MSFTIMSVDSFEKLFKKLRVGDLYRLKHTKSIFRISSKNHTVCLDDTWSSTRTKVTHHYSVTLRHFNGPIVDKYNNQIAPSGNDYLTRNTKRTLSILELPKEYIKLTAKQQRTNKILFGSKK